MKNFAGYFLLPLLGITFSSIAFSTPTNRYALSCNYSDVYSAVQAAVVGDTVHIPSGTCDWATTAPLVINAGIRVRGAGKADTIIRKSLENNNALIQFNCTNGQAVIASDMTLIGFVPQPAAPTSVLDTGLQLAFGCSNFQVFRISFKNFGSSAIEISDNNSNNSSYIKGVIYRNEFIGNYKGNNSAGYGIAVYDDGLSSLTLQLGTENAVFAEDNIFVANKHAIASNRNSIYVLRHNTLIDNQAEFSAVDAHGKSNPSFSGSLGWEIYKNEIYQTRANTFNSNANNSGYAGIGIRGGTGVIFKNNINNVTNPILLTVEDSASCANMTYPVTGQPGAPSKIYLWDNSPNQVKVQPGCEHLIQSGRDYAIQKLSGYTEYAYPHPLRLD